MRALCSWVSQVQKSSTHAAGCSMRTLCSWAKILRNITSRLARQRTTHAAPAACVEKPHHWRSCLYVLKWPFWGNGGMVANSANSSAFYTILTNIWHPWRSWVRLHMEVQLELWEQFESNLLVCTLLTARWPHPWDKFSLEAHGQCAWTTS